jgi:hypothetical protein
MMGSSCLELTDHENIPLGKKEVQQAVAKPIFLSFALPSNAFCVGNLPKSRMWFVTYPIGI